jgi:hypothetical protein
MRLLESVVIGGALGFACGFLLLAILWLPYHGPQQVGNGDPRAAFAGLSLLDLAYLAVLSGTKAGAVCYPIARMLFIPKPPLAGILSPIAACTIIGGLVGYHFFFFFTLKAAEVGAIVGFWFAVLPITQSQDDKRSVVYYRGPGHGLSWFSSWFDDRR